MARPFLMPHKSVTMCNMYMIGVKAVPIICLLSRYYFITFHEKILLLNLNTMVYFFIGPTFSFFFG